jgi:hypothetical protein
MNIEHKEFVGFYHELFPAGYCQYLITEFNRLEEGGIGSNRQRGEGAHKHVKDDYQIGINLKSHNLEPFKWMEGETEFNRDGCDLFFDGLQKCYDEYSSKYSILRAHRPRWWLSCLARGARPRHSRQSSGGLHALLK